MGLEEEGKVRERASLFVAVCVCVCERDGLGNGRGQMRKVRRR